MTERWHRSQRAAAVDVGEDIVLVDRTGTVRRLAGDGAELARELLAFLAYPRTDAEILAHVESLAGPLGERVAVVRDLVHLLAETGAVATRAADDRDARPAIGVNIVVGVCGAIAATHAPAFVTALQRRGHRVEVALSSTADRFVAVDALAAIAQREVNTTMWPSRAHAPVPHVALADWADLVVLYPASATTLARLAHGELSDLVAAIALTTRAPVVLVPSMNVDMLEAPAVQRNLAQLRGDGFAIVHGVPSVEVADAPAVRAPLAGAAPAPGDVAATIDALRTAGVLARRDGERDPHAWDAFYRGAAGDRALVPWASDSCDADLAAALATHAPPPARLLDIGCGLGQVARHAAALGYRVVATDLADTALALARERSADHDIVWLRDDICATALFGPFDAIVDRATLHALTPHRKRAWAAAVARLIAPGGTLIVKAFRDAWSRELVPDFDVIAEHAAELPAPTDATPVASVLAVLRRR